MTQQDVGHITDGIVQNFGRVYERLYTENADVDDLREEAKRYGDSVASFLKSVREK